MSQPPTTWPVVPRSTDVAWRLAPLADKRRMDVFLRMFGAKALPIGVNHGRLAAMGLPDDTMAETLQRIRSVADWDIAWTWAAQRFLGEARTHERTGHGNAAALAQRHASLAFHLASMLVFNDPRKTRTLRASATSLYARALPLLRPSVHRVELAWRTARLPGFLALPEDASSPVPLVVLLNGTSTSKEETLLWADAFLARRLAVLALDWPGSGESALTVAPTADCDDFTDGVLALARDVRLLDTARVALVGFSLGGALAAMAAAGDRRIQAIVAVTPPYDPLAWMTRSQPLLRQHLAALAGGEDESLRLAAEFALPGVVERSRCPVLVIGAGRDLIVPPGEAMRYCAAAGERGTLLWYPDGSHGLYDELPDWTAEAARWLEAVLSGATPSTWVDALHEPLSAAS